MDLVIPAFAKVHSAFPDVRLLIVGDGSLRQSMLSQAEEAGITDFVEFAGRQPQDKLQYFYDRIDLLLMPSRSEGFGLTAIEGMARGCVPVVSDTGGLPEVVRNGKDGLLHTPENAEDMAAKIIALLKDGELRERLVRNAPVRAEDFSAVCYNAQILTWYKSL